MTQRAINWALALAITALIATMQWLDGPDDIQTDRAIAADLADAQAQALAADTTQVQP
jgi:hypothetical protein